MAGMSLTEWGVQWKRLDQFRVGGDADRAQVSAEWFAQLRHHHVDAVDHGITRLIGSATDTFLPGLGLLKGFIQERIDKYERTGGKCATCHGATWVEAWPVVWCGHLYEMHSRCPDCGIPAPEMKKPHTNARPATKLEYDEWQAGRYARNQMPPGLEAKPWKSEQARLDHKAKMRENFERLRIKLFGKDAA